MLKSWYNFGMLAAEAQQVIWLRLMKLAAGGSGAQHEAQLMVTEKLTEASRATGRLMMGATPDSVVKGYRRKVRANARRLSR